MYVGTSPGCEYSISAFTHPNVIKAIADAGFILFLATLHKLGHTTLLAQSHLCSLPGNYLNSCTCT